MDIYSKAMVGSDGSLGGYCARLCRLAVCNNERLELNDESNLRDLVSNIEDSWNSGNNTVYSERNLYSSYNEYKNHFGLA